MATGRGNGTRTRTVFLPTDFKSAVYANSTIPPYGRSGVDRTHDLLLAKQTFYQLNYDPINQVLSKAAFPYLSLTNCRKKSRPLILEWSC